MHRPGEKHVNADSLSRYPLEEGEEHEHSISEPISDIQESIIEDLSTQVEAEECTRTCSLASPESEFCRVLRIDVDAPAGIVEAQKADGDLKTVRKWLEAGERPPKSKLLQFSFALRRWWSVFGQLELKNDLVYYRWESMRENSSELRVVVPDSMKLEIFRLGHSDNTAGHFGVHKTLRRIRQTFYFTGLDAFVKEQIKKCRTCERRRSPIPHRRAPLQDMLVCRPLDRIGMDIVGPFPAGKDYNRVILVVQDYLTNVQESTGFTPARLMLGREMVTPLSFVAGRPPGEPCDDVGTYAEDVEQRMRSAFDMVEESLGAAHKRQKVVYDSRKHGKKFELGDRVWLHSPAVKRGLSRKLHKPWTGPFVIVKVLSDVNFKIQLEGGRKSYVVHFNRLKPCYSDQVAPEQLSQSNTEQAAAAVEPRDVTVTVPESGRDVPGEVEWQDDAIDFDPEDVEVETEPVVVVPAVSPIRTRRGRKIELPFRFRNDFVMRCRNFSLSRVNLEGT
ncbi:uncharacterized protein LOC135489780 [Lineus longissimus]|uniref:uncharacterized protein LOC135489780 n=1 Tax=Lineus longissimus TaxID=88925 RepID=UPI00315C7273